MGIKYYLSEVLTYIFGYKYYKISYVVDDGSQVMYKESGQKVNRLNCPDTKKQYNILMDNFEDFENAVIMNISRIKPEPDKYE